MNATLASGRVFPLALISTARIWGVWESLFSAFFFLENFWPDDFEKVECGAHHSHKKIFN